MSVTLSVLQTPIATPLTKPDGTINHVWNEFFIRLMKNAGITVDIAALEADVADLQNQIDDINVAEELADTITMSDSDSNTANTLSVLYDNTLDSNGVTYDASGGDKYIEYEYKITNYFDRIGLWTSDANGQVIIAYSTDDVNWSYLKAEADHTLDSNGKLLTESNYASAVSQYWQLTSGQNIAIFPNNLVAKQIRVWFVDGSATTLYEMVPSRMLISEMAVIENLAAVSATFGPVSGYNQIIDRPTNLSDINSTEGTKLSNIEDGATRNEMQGDWTDATAYVIGDIVIDNDHGWICILGHTSNDGVNNPPTYPTTSNTWWSIFTVKGEDGIPGSDGNDGADGANTATVFLYQRASSSPSVPSVTSTYTFSTGVLTGHNNNWTQGIPATDGNPAWVTTAVAVGTDTTDTILTGEWATPTKLVEDGSTGSDGLNTATIYLYQRATSSPVVTDIDDPVTYTFSTAAITGSIGSWSTSVPSGTNPIYLIAATATASTSTDTVARSEWSTPVVLAENGAAGDPGAAGPAVVLTSDRQVSFTATDGTLDEGQDDIVFTATVQGIISPTYSWSQTGCQNAPTASTSSTYTVTAANFGTSKSAIVTCTVNGTYVNKTTIVRLEISTAEAGATDNSDLGTGYTTIIGDVISVYSNYLTITANVNDELDWTENSTTYNTTLTASSTYTPTTLASHIQTQMRSEGDNNTTVTYNSTTRKITIANSTLTTFTLLWNTGTNSSDCCAEVLGFSKSSDSTGALTYTGSVQTALRVKIGDLS